MPELHTEDTVFDLEIATLLRPCKRFLLVAWGGSASHWRTPLRTHQLLVLLHRAPDTEHRLLFVAERQPRHDDPHGHTTLLGASSPLQDPALIHLYDLQSIQTFVDVLLFPDTGPEPPSHYIAIVPPTERTDPYHRALDRYRLA